METAIAAMRRIALDFLMVSLPCFIAGACNAHDELWAALCIAGIIGCNFGVLVGGAAEILDTFRSDDV